MADKYLKIAYIGGGSRGLGEKINVRSCRCRRYLR